MKNKDQKILEEIYLKTKNIITEQADDVFHSAVKLEVDVDYDSEKQYIEIDAPEQINVTYSIYIEYRSYGIKGIDVHFISAAPFSFDTIDYDENDNPIRKTIEVDLSVLPEVQTEFNIGTSGQVYPLSLSVKINRDLKPYSATLEF